MAVKTKGTIVVAGSEMTISNPGKLLWPEMEITKLAFLEKLIELSPYLINYCARRYLTVIRYPNGIHGKSFYQKNCPDPIPGFVRTAEQNGIRYVVLDSLPTLVWLGNLACLEYHASCDRIGEPDKPTEWVLDIDPSLEEEPRIMEAAWLAGELLRSLGISAVPKTSGATGVQIIVPLQPDLTFDELRAVGRFVGDYLSRTHPKLFTIERMKRNRGDLIYFDYLQHYQGKTLSAPYTPRARAAASVSTPLTWEEVRADARPTAFHLLNIGERLRRHGDLLERAPVQNLRPILEFIRKK
ncbi:DNA polymerase [Paenibacillus darwinianus]|uniref:DNA polymerase n=1 Tax=Paenibacillus darwinianus TaxID=1380763 RepID=A0A9W5S211_9BACL|nr:non-homologous end-joining DNA ligase [Paenibacillus darwinianus]EXX87957.1 DNA polymerase [Paenibacillus darwinianus]EXX90468.1 DNA polymerase [Paenibacillus darwinianus]EXX90494.1 DNA polymerase [Paenibacillus darwinianus]